MNDEQRKNIARGLAITAEVCGSQLSEGAIAVMIEELATYESEDVSEALRRVMREHTGRLSLAVIIERIDEGKGLGVDAAWELAVRARIWDQGITLVIPKARSLQSWPPALWNVGDKVAARLAFKAAYPKYLADLGDEVFVSLGWDAEGRRTAIEEAARNGVITQAHAAKLLPDPEITDPKSRAMIAELASSTKQLGESS